MSDHICYCAVPGTLGSIRNRENTGGETAPELIMGLPCELRLRLFANCADTTAYPIGRFAEVRGWSFELDTDFSQHSPSKIIADNADIALSEVAENGTTYTQLDIPISDTCTEELAAALDGKESIVLAGELRGYDAGHEEIFVLQIKGFTVRGRIAGIGEPTPIPTAAYEELASRTVTAVLNSSGAALIASTAVYEIVASGGYVSGGDVASMLNVSALPKDQPFSTTVRAGDDGFYRLVCTSGGLTVNYGEGYDETPEPPVTKHEIAFDSGGVTADGSALAQTLSNVSGTSLGIPVVSGGVMYVCSNPLSRLTIGSAAPGCNATILFTLANGGLVTPPANVPFLGAKPVSGGAQYAITINGHMAYCLEAVVPEQPVDGSTGVWLKSGTSVLSASMLMSGVVVGPSQAQYVYARGIAESCTLDATSATQSVGSGGIALDTTVYYRQTVLSGGTAIRTVLGPSGAAPRLFMSTGAFASDTLILAGAMQLPAGASAPGIVMSSGQLWATGYTTDVIVRGGVMSVYAGASISGITQSGGTVLVLSGGTVSGVALTGGTLNVNPGGSALGVTSTGGTISGTAEVIN